MTEPDRIDVNCSRCLKNMIVTKTFRWRKDQKREPILCKDCRMNSEVSTITIGQNTGESP